MNAQRIVSVVWFAFGAAVAYESLDLGLGEGGEPGSGFMPFIAGLFVCAMAVIVFLQTFVNQELKLSTFAEHWKGGKWHRAIWIVLLSVLFIEAMNVLGYFVSSVMLLVIIMRYLEHLSWTKSIVVPVVTVAVTYLLFSWMLDTTMPRGILGLW